MQRAAQVLSNRHLNRSIEGTYIDGTRALAGCDGKNTAEDCLEGVA